MATVTISGPKLGNALQTLLVAEDIQPGDAPSYETCKAILVWHPLGAKMAESPIKMAQSQERIIEVPGSPEDRVKDAFRKEWLKLNATRLIRNTMKTSRAYGIASIAMLEPGGDMSKPPDMASLYKKKIAFNVFDPLNTAGSLVLNQDPNALDFQKHNDIRVSGVSYHRSRTEVVLCGDPIYIEYTSSAFGFVGRSVYQPALFPLKSFINTMVTDDLVTRKAGVFIAKLKQVTSAVDSVVSKLFGFKRAILKEAEVGNVISISTEESVETLNMTNLDGAYGMARDNILKNCATASDMPASLLNNETMVKGFGEGSEDAKNTARYIDDIREQMQAIYAWFDQIVQYRAWNPDFYATIQADFPEEYGNVTFEEAFYKWVNAFEAKWPSLLIEPDSERAKADKVRLDALIASVDVLLPALDPLNKATLIQFLADNMNAMKLLFPMPLELNIQDLIDYVPPAMLGSDGEQGNEDDSEDKPSLAPVEAEGAKAHRLRAVNG
jgi:hypothetical protein